ncbi:nucleoside-diphosphate kinase [Tissierella creatinophila]|uniref:Nucleoside diphosphate kinase n=1 Tax=Tissierella creatinophila DSM 6911 TaxID=1123403 RepID=A0A1U7M3N1_TISCR|nr:nucleoside-diphosphate kinase [Tissierella creatinophila]OLS01901.1 nucleoside diphosphate kinase [Tissierella creatinophila DSM 6911]
MERTFIMIKPDGIQRRIMGEVISRIENKGFKILRAKLFKPSKSLIEEHYQEHREKEFFHELIDYISGESVMIMEVEGESAVEVMRLMIGNKDPKLAAPGTIRGDFSNEKTQNVIHGSDSIENANREISLWF